MWGGHSCPPCMAVVWGGHSCPPWWSKMLDFIFEIVGEFLAGAIFEPLSYILVHLGRAIVELARDIWMMC